ncbi:hypothetical protein EDB81DRAFT_881702 [Dactylonectria macrodidyma]|uniref:Uncharacterized protein n=1 Tax=Dactylonectria macrodidyma TaxID=307937 RepID=A0A9P9F410_9HYPO|nr:hypothetical protein EDB81DRAFT_881702 [Dactylonectria macrodidyma]
MALPTEPVSPADIAIAKRCDFEDDFGCVDCGTFSVVFGDTSKQGTDVEVKTWLTITGAGFRYRWQLNCSNGGETWNSFTSELPWTVDIHPGNTCW